VQGDERDVILFSICYGPDAKSRVVMNFGPLNNTGGERRLNVAVTRARRQLIVFSTLRPEQIDVSRTQAKGVIHLREFMEFARASGRIADAGTEPQGDQQGKADAFSLGQAVTEALVKHNWSVEARIGCSGYRIDLAVRHPEQAARFLMGIEFDGPNYRSAKTARDRDRLRASVLAGLGWRLHRIWSSDWWQEPDREFARLESALKAALAAPQEQVAAAPPPSPVAAVPRIERNLGAMPKSRSLQGAETYARANHKPEPFPRGDDAAMLAELHRGVVAILAREAPIREEQLLRGVAGMFGNTPLTEGVRQTILAAIPDSSLRTTTETGRRFVWRGDQSLGEYRTFRVPATGDESPRPLADIPPEETANAMQQVMGQHLSLVTEDLYKEVSLVFGCRRLTGKAKEHLAEALEHLIANGHCTEQNGTLRVVET